MRAFGRSSRPCAQNRVDFRAITPHHDAGTTMTKPSTVVIAGASGLLLLGLVVRHFRSSDSDTSATRERTLAAARLNSERPGWSARQDSNNPEQSGGSSAPSRLGNRESGAAGSGSGAGPSGGHDGSNANRA